MRRTALSLGLLLLTSLSLLADPPVAAEFGLAAGYQWRLCQHRQFALVERRPVVVQNAARVARVRVPRPLLCTR
jgi:hypothetical protein